MTTEEAKKVKIGDVVIVRHPPTLRISKNMVLSNAFEGMFAVKGWPDEGDRPELIHIINVKEIQQGTGKNWQAPPPKEWKSGDLATVKAGQTNSGLTRKVLGPAIWFEQLGAWFVPLLDGESGNPCFSDSRTLVTRVEFVAEEPAPDRKQKTVRDVMEAAFIGRTIEGHKVTNANISFDTMYDRIVVEIKTDKTGQDPGITFEWGEYDMSPLDDPEGG